MDTVIIGFLLGGDAAEFWRALPGTAGHFRALPHCA